MPTATLHTISSTQPFSFKTEKISSILPFSYKISASVNRWLSISLSIYSSHVKAQLLSGVETVSVIKLLKYKTYFRTHEVLKIKGNKQQITNLLKHKMLPLPVFSLQNMIMLLVSNGNYYISLRMWTLRQQICFWLNLASSRQVHVLQKLKLQILPLEISVSK